MKVSDGELAHKEQSEKPKARALKTFWHYPYASLVKERKPPGWEIVVENLRQGEAYGCRSRIIAWP